MEFRVLGPIEVASDGRVLRLGSGKQLGLVTVLLLHANEPVSVDRLVDELWDESPPPTAAKIVRNYVSVLRKELGDRLETRPPGYLLRVEESELDSARLERAVRSGDLDDLTDALALWRGPPLSQLRYEPFAQNEVARLDALHLSALEGRIAAELALGRHVAVVAELEALVGEHPLRERLYELLMLALYRSGRQADALDVYQRSRRALDEELGIEPGPALRNLERMILNQDPSLGAPAPAPTPAAPAGRSRRLPLALVTAAAVLAGVAAIGFLAARDPAGGLSEIPPNYVGVLDPGTNAVVAAIPVGIRPGPIATGNGVVWVGNVDDRNLTKIDSRQRLSTGTVGLDDRTPTGLAVGAGGVWVAHGRGGEVSVIDPQFDRLAETITVAERSATGSVAVGARHVWAVFGDSTLVRILPEGARPSGSALTGAIPSAVVVGAGAVWVANSNASTVQRFDPVTFQEGSIRSISVGRRPAALAFGEDAVWVANRGDDTVTRIDPSTDATVDVAVGDEPVSLAVGAGAVWVANSGDGTVSRIDPATNEIVESIAVGNAPGGIAVANGFVWVTAQAP